MRIRRAILEAALRSKSNFRSALSQLELWMDRIELSVDELEQATSNMQSLKNSVKRKRWNEAEKVLL